MYKFSLVFLFFLSFKQVFADLDYSENERFYFIYLNENQEAYLQVSKLGALNIQLSQRHVKVDEKLGSYQVIESPIREGKKLELNNLELISKHSIHLTYSFVWKGKVESLHLKLEERNESLVWTVEDISVSEINKINFSIPNISPAIFGGGIQFSNCNLKGKSFPIVVEENGIGRGDKGSSFLAGLVGAAGNEFASYAPLPFFISSNGFSYELSNSGKAIWQVNFEEKSILNFSLLALEKHALNSASIQIKMGTPIDLVSEQNLHRNFPLKDWMYGYILGVQGGKQRVDSLLQILQENKIKVSAIWIQDWVGKRATAIGSRLQWDWHVNERYYPNTTAWIDSLKEKNIKVLAYINPYFVEGGQQAAEGIEKSYFVRNDDGSSYKFKAGGFDAYMLDPSNESARTWLKNIIKTEIVELGFSGWMCDFGEWLPFYPKLKNDRVIEHNDFPVEWLELNWEAARELGVEDEMFIFNRSAYTGTSEQSNIMWLGDQMSNFGENDGLPSAICAYNSASLSGFPIVHSDIGGYTAIKLGPFNFLRNDEVLKRWIEMEAFTPLWRSHEGLRPEQMSQIYQDEEMMRFFAYFDSIHLSLLPYFKEVNQELLDKGYPMVRHPFLLYPKDLNCYNLKYEFFVGSKLLVCPVIEENSTKVEAYLPEGKWKDFFSDEVFEGKQSYIFSAPLGRPRIFWKLD